MIPKVLVVHVQRPMCLGLFFDFGFRQAGCQVKTAGPFIPHVYGKTDGSEHTFTPDDVVPPDFELPNQPCDVNQVLDYVKGAGFEPDLIVCVDQYDPMYLTGQTARAKFVTIAVENWNQDQYNRWTQRTTDAEFHMIAHSNEAPLPENSEWLPFAADPYIHADLGMPRDKWVVQVGTHYEPRPQIWNALRMAFDGAHPAAPAIYGDHGLESEHTWFGRAPSYREMAEVYSRGLTTISSSNVPFLPMRIFEAWSFGCVLLSDDVEPIRRACGAPYASFDGHGVSMHSESRQTSGAGMWIAHDRTAASIQACVESVVSMDETERRALLDRAAASVLREHTYYHRARRILDRVGLRGATRMV